VATRLASSVLRWLCPVPAAAAAASESNRVSGAPAGGDHDYGAGLTAGRDALVGTSRPDVPRLLDPPVARSLRCSHVVSDRSGCGAERPAAALLPADLALDRAVVTVTDSAHARWRLLDVVNRLGRGFRASLGRPGNRGIVWLAFLVAVLGALFGAAGATRVGWEFAPALPSGAEAAEIGQTVFPGMTVSGDDHAPLWSSSADGEHLEYGTARYMVEPTSAGAGDFTAGVRDRLAAAGWRLHEDALPVRGVDPADVTPTETYPVRATRGDLMLTYTGGAGFALARAAPGWMWIFVAAGALLGAFVGWLLTGWASRRAAEGSVAAQVAGLVAWPTAVAVPILLLGGLLFRPDSQSWSDAFYLRLLYAIDGPPRWVGVVAAVALGTVAVSRRPLRRVSPA
jgi:hypothetical protein